MNIAWIGKTDGNLTVAENFLPPRVPGSSDELSIAALTAAAITDLNAVYSTECDDLVGWDVISGTFTIVDGVMQGEYGTSALHSIALPTTDYIFYLKAKTSQIVGSSCSIILGYPLAVGVAIAFDHNGSSAEIGKVCCYVNGVTHEIAAGIDTASYSEWAIQVDRKQSKVYFYHRTGPSEFNYLGDFPYTTLATDTDMKINVGATIGQHLYVDYLSVCRPNIIAIGDSNCKRMGMDIGDNSAWDNVHILKTNRNCLIVNKGVGSNTSAMVSARLSADVIAHGPKVCLFECTTNDYGGGITLPQKFAYTQNSVNDLVAAGIDVVLLPCLPGSEPGDAANFYMDFNADYYPLITGASVYCDWLSAVVDSETGLVDEPYIEADDAHLNDAGHVAVGALIESDCDDILEGGLDQKWPTTGSCDAVVIVGAGGYIGYGVGITNRASIDDSTWLSARTQNTIGCDFIRGAA